MRTLVTVLVLLALSPMAALAHHKPGHQIPPGQMKKFQDQVEVRAPVTVIPFSVGTSSLPDELVWRRYVDELYGFEIDLPLGIFEFGDEADRGLFLREVGGQGEMKVYGADNSLGRSPREFASILEESDRIEEVTYRAGGQSWFVLSGYYADDDGFDEPMIFYAKFMFSRDRSHVAAFEISFPQSEKPRFAPLVEHIEDSLRPPL